MENSKKQVRETKAGRSIQAFVIIKPRKGVVATIHAHFADSGMCTVDVWDEGCLVYQGRAGGGGYDKFTNALAGAVIQGITMVDHCQVSKKLGKGASSFPYGTKEPRGYCFANYVADKSGWTSCYRVAGPDLLKYYGFTVEQVI